MTDYLVSFYRSSTSSECELHNACKILKLFDLYAGKKILIATFNPLSEVSGIREDVGNLMLVYQAMEQVREGPDGV